ncbi:MAG: lysostaphin resistance A-like protein [Oscillospiraceae bacterium]
MSEEIITAGEPVPEENNQPDKMKGFKSVCMRLGLMMIVIFVSRGVCSILMSLLAESLDSMGATGYIIETLISFAFLYVIPIVSACLILKMPSGGMCGRIYSKPKYFAEAMGMLPAFYGAAILTNMLTLLISQLFVDTELEKSFNTVNELAAEDTLSAVILFVQLVVIAPLFEEFWFRGIVMESLRPYGNGFAIFVSALLFGMTHANFQQFFYATVLGIGLGYIAVSTRSIIPTMIMHAIFNGISGIMLLFMSAPSVQEFFAASMKGEEAQRDAVVIAFAVFVLLVLTLMFVGVFMAIAKLRKIKKYKVPKMWEGVSTGKRWGVFFSRVTVIVMLLLAADTFTFRYIPKLIYQLISGN